MHSVIMMYFVAKCLRLTAPKQEEMSFQSFRTSRTLWQSYEIVDRDRTVSHVLNPAHVPLLVVNNRTLEAHFSLRMWWADIECQTIASIEISKQLSPVIPGVPFIRCNYTSTSKNWISRTDFLLENPCKNCHSISQLFISPCTRNRDKSC